MLVVSDTSAVSNLAVIGRLRLLEEAFGLVMVPTAVLNELTNLSHPDGKAAVDEAFRLGWLQAAEVPAQTPYPAELAGLDAGETAAIRLALGLKADRLLIDERKGRAAADKLGIAVVGVLGILLAAKNRGAITSVRGDMERLRAEAGFFIAPKLYAQVLHFAGE
jgi:uncharacterized protein